MCYYCLEGDGPFQLRGGSAFPRKRIAGAAQADGVAAQAVPSEQFSCDAPQPAIPPSVWPKRKSATSSS
jgi:hypothetical protein